MLVREHFRPTGNPVADPANVVMGDGYRITLLTDGLVRLEWSASGEFEDRASQAVVDRAFPPTEFQVVETDDRLTIHTARLQLVYDKRPFSTEGLSVQAKGGFRSDRSVWRFGLPTVNLGGTARTLDDVDGPVPLEPGILVPRRRHLLRRLPDGAADRRRLDRAAPPGHPRPLRLRLRPRLPRRAARLLPPDRPPAAAAALRAGQLVEPLPPPTPPTSTSADGPVRRRGHPAVGRGAGHGLAPRRHRPPPRQRLDRLHLEPRAVPRSAGVPRRPARARARDDPQRAPGRGRARPRGALRGDRASGWASIPTSELPVDFDPADPAFLEAYLEELHHPARGRGRRLLVAGLAAGRGHPHARARPAVAAQPLPLPGLGTKRRSAR